MKNYFSKIYCTLFTILLINIIAIAQPTCPSIVINNTSINDASCPSSGVISISATGSGLTYRIISGPSGYLATSNTTGIFSGLLAGSYIIEVKDNCNVVNNVTASVVDTYPAFSINSDNIVNVCSSGSPGGTISFTVNGGKSPYQYDVVTLGNTPTYSANINSTAFSKNVTTFGTFRIYVKDACGEVRTKEVTIQKTQPKPYMWWNELRFDRPCGEIMDGLNTVSLMLHFNDENVSGINMSELIGTTINVYKPTVPNSINSTEEGGACSIAMGSLLSSTTISAGNLSSYIYDYPVSIPKEDVILVITTLCGDELKICYNYNDGLSDAGNVNYYAIQSTCNATWINQTVDIENVGIFGMKEPINYVLTKNGGSTETNTHGYFYGLNPSNFPVTIVATDACGVVSSKTITMPTQGSALQATIEPEWNYTCTDVKNSVTAIVKLTGGDLQGIGDATNVTITGGPVTAVPKISKFNYWIPGYAVSNIVAGYTYKIMITNLCGEKDSILFTSTSDLWGQDPLNWNLQATVTPLCGQNKGNILAKSNYSGMETVEYSIYNNTTGLSNTAIATNTSGIFNNLSAGNYKVKINIDVSYAPECPNNFIRDSIVVTIVNDAVGQAITKKTILTCEASGVPTNNGKAIIEVNGAAPYTYEIIKTNLIGTGSENWIVSSTNNNNSNYTWDIPLAGDPMNTVYTLRSTDKCGNKITTLASLQPLSPPVSTNQVQPCLGQINFSTGVEAYAGSGFSYRWVKLPDLVTTISTSNKLQFTGAYSAAFDGNYKCYISFGSCIEREFDVTLNNVFCGMILPVKLISFNGHIYNNNSQINWKVENEKGIKYYLVERSINGNNFQFINTLGSKQNNSLPNDYAINDDISNINSNVIYYRLKMVDNDGSFTYSNIIKLTKNSSLQNVQVYPNPVKDIFTINFNSNISSLSDLKIFDNSGKLVYVKKINVFKGLNAIQLNNNFHSGEYYIEIKTENLKLFSRFTKL